jgi:hypothetical protein
MYRVQLTLILRMIDLYIQQYSELFIQNYQFRKTLDHKASTQKG